MVSKEKQAKNRAYYEKNREAVKARSREYYNDNIEKVKARSKVRSITRYKRLRGEIFNKLGKKCVSCGFGNILALQIDHIKGRGRQHRLEYGSNYCGYYQSILKDTTDYQILCANCNTIKMYDKKEHPKTFSQ